jgi:hypothetical protein
VSNPRETELSTNNVIPEYYPIELKPFSALLGLLAGFQPYGFNPTCLLMGN